MLLAPLNGKRVESKPTLKAKERSRYVFIDLVEWRTILFPDADPNTFLPQAAQAKGYAEGLADQVGGYKDSVVGAVTGDKTKQVAGNARNEAGSAKKEANAPA